MIKQYHNGQWRVVSGKSQNEILVIVAEDSETISGISVPKLDEDQVQVAYNGIVAGKGVFIQGENDDYYAVYFANTADEVPTIYLIYKDSHIIKYELDEEVSISVKEIGSGSGAVESVNGKIGVVVLDGTDIQITTTHTTLQANIIRIDEEISRVEGKFDQAVLDLGDEIDDVRDIAQSKTVSYVVDDLDDITGTQDEDGNFTSVTAITGVDLEDLKIGDNIFVKDVEAPDFWVSAITPAVALNKLQTEKIDIENYYTKDETYSADQVDALLEDKADTSDLANYAKLEQGFNVINASEIVNNTLTQAQYDLITNGKPTLIKGTLFNVLNPEILTLGSHTNGYGGLLVASKNAGGETRFYTVLINSTSKVISLSSTQNTFLPNGRWELRISQINDKVFPSYSKGALYYNGTNLSWNDSFIPSVETISTATYSGGLTSNKEYKFLVPATDLSIAALEVQTGDATPCWKIKFIVGSGFAFSSTPTLVWKDGQPTWSDLVGEEVEILIEPSLTANTYNAWIIK